MGKKVRKTALVFTVVLVKVIGVPGLSLFLSVYLRAVQVHEYRFIVLPVNKLVWRYFAHPKIAQKVQSSIGHASATSEYHPDISNINGTRFTQQFPIIFALPSWL